MLREYRVYKGAKKRARTMALSITERNELIERGGFVVCASEPKELDRDKMSAKDVSKARSYDASVFPTLYGAGCFFNVGHTGKVRVRSKAI